MYISLVPRLSLEKGREPGNKAICTSAACTTCYLDCNVPIESSPVLDSLYGNLLTWLLIGLCDVWDDGKSQPGDLNLTAVLQQGCPGNSHPHTAYVAG